MMFPKLLSFLTKVEDIPGHCLYFLFDKILQLVYLFWKHGDELKFSWVCKIKKSFLKCFLGVHGVFPESSKLAGNA